MPKLKNSVLAVLVAAMTIASFPAHAVALPGHAGIVGIVGTEQMVSQHARTAALDRIEQALAGAEVAVQLKAWGVGPEQVAQRVAAMSDIELAMLADTMETDPAGGVLVVLGVVFLVLIIIGALNVVR